MAASWRVFPQPLDLIDPRMIDGSKEQFELGVVGEPALCDVAFMNHEVFEDKGDALSAPIGHFRG